MAEQLSPQEQKKIQNLFNKGFAAFERGNLDIAIELLFQCIETDATFSRARKFLRMASMQKFTKSKPGAFKIGLAEIQGTPLSLKATSLLKAGKTKEAVIASEKLIEVAPLCPKYVILAAKCALEAGDSESAIMLLESALLVDLKNKSIKLSLAETYAAVNNWKKAREIYSVLVNENPQDGILVSKLKDAEARMTMSSGWEEVVNSNEKEGFRKLIKDKEEADKLDMKNKSVVATDDAESLIAEQKEKIAKDPRNINYYRALARIYQQQKRYDEAAATLDEAKKINSADPELDRFISTIKTLAYDSKIEALKAAGDEAGAENLLGERNQFVFDDLLQRVENYPNDLRLRYELGQQYLMYEAYDDAIQQFQLSQRSPKERSQSLHGLARCFRAKGQTDMAIMQLETALEQLPVMDDMRKAVLFDLGELVESTGDIERAFKLYREVYGADIGYKDIDVKMQRVYQLRKNAQTASGAPQA